MKRSILISIKEFLSTLSRKPWACFETSGINKDGLIEFSISYNKAFVNHLRSYGLEATTDEELVQTFFVITRMTPASWEDNDSDEAINPSATPNLTSEANRLVK